MAARTGEGAGKPGEALARLLEETADSCSTEAFWHAVRRGIRGSLGQERYSIWFEQTELVGLADGSLLVGVPNIIIQQFLTERYAGAVASVVAGLVGRSIPVRFEVAPRLFRRMRAKRQAQMTEAEQQAVGPPGSAHGFAPARPAPRPPQDWGFENLIVVASNRLPVAAARELGGQESPRFRFLYVCGDYGLGKSALLHGIYALACGPERGLKPIYISAEEWSNDYYHAIEQKKTRAFRSRYRSCDVLLMDDIQFVQGKMGAQQELVHTVKHVLDRGGRVALGGRPYPEEIGETGSAIQALLQKAFPAPMVRPQEDERLEIMRLMLKGRGLCADEGVCRFITRSRARCFASMRAAVSRLALFAAMEGRDRLDLPLAVRAFAGMRPPAAAPVGLPQVKEAVLGVFDVTAQELAGRSRLRSICRARQVAMYLSRKMTGASLTEIGRFYGKFSHSTVKHAVGRIESEAARDDSLAAVLARLASRLGEPGLGERPAASA
jgi:chromosomal replication initiator protein